MANFSTTRCVLVVYSDPQPHPPPPFVFLRAQDESEDAIDERSRSFANTFSGSPRDL